MKKMAEYISKQSIIDYLNGYLHSIGEGGADSLLFDRGQRRALINSIQDISAVEAADVQPVDRWISVKDRLPDEDGGYLVCKHNRVRVAEWCKDCWYSESDLPIDDCAITYWQPLPKPPKDGDTK